MWHEARPHDPWPPVFGATCLVMALPLLAADRYDQLLAAGAAYAVGWAILGRAADGE